MYLTPRISPSTVLAACGAGTLTRLSVTPSPLASAAAVCDGWRWRADEAAGAFQEGGVADRPFGEKRRAGRAASPILSAINASKRARTPCVGNR